MIQYNPQVNDMRGDYMMQAAQAQANMYNQLGQDIGGALSNIGEMYGKYKDKKEMLKGIDTAARAMVDLNVIKPDFYEKYMASDEAVRPFLFQAIASPMFQSFTAGQSAAAQAKAWDQYRQGAPDSGPQSRNKYGYRYQGP